MPYYISFIDAAYEASCFHQSVSSRGGFWSRSLVSAGFFCLYRERDWNELARTPLRRAIRSFIIVSSRPPDYKENRTHEVPNAGRSIRLLDKPACTCI